MFYLSLVTCSAILMLSMYTKKGLDQLHTCQSINRKIFDQIVPNAALSPLCQLSISRTSNLFSILENQANVDLFKTALHMLMLFILFARTLYECAVLGVKPVCIYVVLVPLLTIVPSTSTSYSVAPAIVDQLTVIWLLVDTAVAVGVVNNVFDVTGVLQFPAPPVFFARTRTV